MASSPRIEAAFPTIRGQPQCGSRPVSKVWTVWVTDDDCTTVVKVVGAMTSAKPAAREASTSWCNGFVARTARANSWPSHGRRGTSSEGRPAR